MRPALLWLGILAALPMAAQVAFEKGDGSIAVTVDGKPFTTFYYATSAAKPYLSPLNNADGKRMTRLYPMEQVEGESRDHPHHRGLWFTHGDVNKYTFWDNEAANRGPMKKGTVTHGQILKAQGGKKSGTIVSRFDWVTDTGDKLLTEDRTMTFSGGKDVRIVDFDVTFTAAVPVKFGDTKEGTFAIRLREELIEGKKGTGKMVNAEGKAGMKEVWGKPSPWVDYTGTLDGQPAGIVIFDHPKNPKHPTTWHARDYGLFAVNPFGDHDFQNDKTKDGSISIETGKTLRFSYRVLIHGAADAKQIAAWYAQYSKTK
jgi:hypothetical protein